MRKIYVKNGKTYLHCICLGESPLEFMPLLESIGGRKKFVFDP